MFEVQRCGSVRGPSSFILGEFWDVIRMTKVSLRKKQQFEVVWITDSPPTYLQ